MLATARTTCRSTRSESLRSPCKDFHNYDVRTRHTNADLADAGDIEGLKQSAVVLR